ncbi:MAG TPA: glycosyltransferase family 4 protein [Chitinophagaceae bacterium]|nr:glycosyltransferase family 4 protein [Chitinophagaceae bacterium]
MDKHLHIISFTVPWPVDYGGVYDLFFKLPALQAQGVKIHLHCFDYGRGEQHELEKYCEEVFYYGRNTGHKGVSMQLPYIVASRKNDALLERLLQDAHPIFMEGVHCTYLTTDSRFRERKKFVRMHNVEYKYYYELMRCTSHPLKKIYFWNESRLLKKYEQQLTKNATAFWGVTEIDTECYRKEFHCGTADYLPLFLPHWYVSGAEGKGNYCLYHGNLSVPENDYAATWLLKNVFHEIEIPLVIAGKNPSKNLEALAHAKEHTCMVANPSEKEMQDMIAKAHIHVLPSFNNTGIKLKLLNALFNGRHCVVNSNADEGTGLEKLCRHAGNAEEFQQVIQQLYHQPFTHEDISARKKILHRHFSNEASANQMVKWIWETYK